jgi:hypothetical protein
MPLTVLVKTWRSAVPASLRTAACARRPVVVEDDDVHGGARDIWAALCTPGVRSLDRLPYRPWRQTWRSRCIRKRVGVHPHARPPANGSTRPSRRRSSTPPCTWRPPGRHAAHRRSRSPAMRLPARRAWQVEGPSSQTTRPASRICANASAKTVEFVRSVPAAPSTYRCQGRGRRVETATSP